MSAQQQPELIAEEKTGKLKKRSNGDLALTQPIPAASSPMDLIRMAVDRNAGIEVIERLKAIYDAERRKVEEGEFNAAMSRAQAKLTAIAPKLENDQTHSKYASYAAIDKVLRPIYSAEGFSLSFNTEESNIPDHIRITCDVCHEGGFTKHYSVLMPIVTTGPQGKAVMTKTHATGSAMTYGKRYLVGFAFNLAIGETDDDGNGGQWSKLESTLAAITNAPDLSALDMIFRKAYSEVKSDKETPEKVRAQALLQIINARDARKAELVRDEPA